jgi:hypothetical protein
LALEVHPHPADRAGPRRRRTPAPGNLARQFTHLEDVMRLTIFGASGRTGRRLVEQALHAGYHLTAVVRDPARLPVRHDRLQVLPADLLDATAIQPAVASADAVASTLGPRSYWQASSIISATTASILDAMRAPAPAAWSWSAPPGRHRRPRHHPVLPAAGRAAAAGAAAPRLRRHGRDGGHDQAQRNRLDDPAPTPAHRRPRTAT